MSSWRARTSRTPKSRRSPEYTDLIEQGGGKVTKSEYWGVKGLAYKIKKNRKAHFSLLNIDAPPAAVAEMERRMGLSTESHPLHHRVDGTKTEPSAMMRKSDRDERRDGERAASRRSRAAGSAATARAGERRGGFGRPTGPRRRPREREGSTFRARPPRGDREGGERPPRHAREAKETPGAGPAPTSERDKESGA
jgi:small subunit ribosomal protein S6